MENIKLLIQELCKYPTETEWLEFKHNNYNPDMIGEDISALANSAAIHEKNCAYMLCGLENDDHNIVGTDFDLKTLKTENEKDAVEKGLIKSLYPDTLPPRYMKYIPF